MHKQSASRYLPLILAVALFMENIDSNVITTSLPAIAADLGTNPISLKLAMTSYLVALAVFIPISGFIADRFTAKKVFCLALVVFTIGSVLCSVASSLTSFVVTRFVQGMGGAMMVPVGRILLLRSIPKSEIVSSLSWLAIPALTGPLIGPPLGGFITTYWSWHWIFLINIPIGIIGILLAVLYLPNNETPVYRVLDWLGFILSGLALSFFIFGLSIISVPRVSPWIGAGLALLGFILGVAYVFQALRTPFPLLDIRLFQNKIFRSSVVGGTFLRIGIGAAPFLLPLMLQLCFHLTPIRSGLITFIGAMGAICMKLTVTRILNRYCFRNVLVLTGALSAFFIFMNGFFTAHTPYWFILSCLFLGGFFRSLFFSAVNALAYGQITQEKMSQATPLSIVAQQSAIALGVAVGGSILESCVYFRGKNVQLEDFHMAFYLIAAFSCLACVVFWFLPKNAGRELVKKKSHKVVLR